MNYVVLDFETRSLCDLKACGAWRYAEDITTEVLCLCWSFGGGSGVGVWVPGEPFPEALDAALKRDDMFIAHNASFEKAIWRRLMGPAFGWPNIPNNQWHDTMARCAQLVLPQDLDMAATVLRLSNAKDMEASGFTVGLSKPDRKGWLTEITPEVTSKVVRYCQQDVRAQRELHERIGWLSSSERRIWLLDQRINERGVRLDLALVDKMQKIVDDATIPMVKRFEEITGIPKLGSPKLLGWCNERGVPLPNLQKETLARVLEEPEDETEQNDVGDEIDEDVHTELPDDVRAALHIKHLVGSASVKKLKRMKQCVSYDGRARGLLQYHGAGPGLWAGRLLQPQNFPRGTLTSYEGEKSADFVARKYEALMTGDASYVETIIGPPVETVVSSLRHTLIPSVGREFVVGDFAGIQARIALAASGQHDKTALMTQGVDVYIDLTCDIFGMPKPDWSKGKAHFKPLVSAFKEQHNEKRQFGKNSVLGLGFQMGARKFRLRYAKDQTLDFCEGIVRTYRKEWAPRVPELWYGLQDAALATVRDRTPHEAYGVLYKLEDRWLIATRPSGAKQYYFDPQLIRKEMPWSTPDEPDVRLAWNYKAKKMGQWKTIDVFGGLLTENLASGLARDLLVCAMQKCEKENLPIVMTVHDEIICDAEPHPDNAVKLKQIMEDRPAWAVDMQIPVEAECWTGERYRK